MKLEEFVQCTCWVKREINIPGDTSEEIKEHYLNDGLEGGGFEISNTIVDRVDKIPIDSPRKLKTMLGEEIWNSEFPDNWDPDGIIVDELEYQSRIKNMFQ